MEGQFVGASPATRFQTEGSGVGGKRISLEWRRLIGLVKGTLPIVGELHAGLGLIIQAAVIVISQGALPEAFLEGDLGEKKKGSDGAAVGSRGSIGNTTRWANSTLL